MMSLSYLPQCAEIIPFVSRAQRGESSLVKDPKSFLNRVVDDIPSGVFAVDRNWKLVYLNREAERVAMQSRENLIGKHLWDEYEDLVSTEIYTNYVYAMESNRTHEFTAYFTPLNEWFHTKLFPTSDGLTIYFNSLHRAHSI